MSRRQENDDDFLISAKEYPHIITPAVQNSVYERDPVFVSVKNGIAAA